MYTSGSTGTPKGVLGSHMALINRLVWQYRRFPYAVRTVSYQEETSESSASEDEDDGGHESDKEIFIDDYMEVRDDIPVSLMSDIDPLIGRLDGEIGLEGEGEGDERKKRMEIETAETMSSSIDEDNDQMVISVDENINRMRKGSRDFGPPSHTPLLFRGEVVCKRTPVNVIARSPFIFFPSSLRFFCHLLSFSLQVCVFSACTFYLVISSALKNC